MADMYLHPQSGTVRRAGSMDQTEYDNYIAVNSLYSPYSSDLGGSSLSMDSGIGNTLNGLKMAQKSPHLMKIAYSFLDYLNYFENLA